MRPDGRRRAAAHWRKAGALATAGRSRAAAQHWRRREGMDRNIGLEAVRLTEAAAMASARVMGRGDEKLADQAAVDAMRKAFNDLHIRGTIVIGEGERDEAPMLFIGEKVGRGGG